jgi:CheY-like chemotaxis protein
MVILLVDDDSAFLRSFSELLGIYLNNVTILTADSAKKAAEMLKAAVIDLVVTDLRMPGMDGLELVRHMRKHHKRTNVIVMSAADVEKVAQELKELGISNYLEKPFEVPASVAAIKKGLAAVH